MITNGKYPKEYFWSFCVMGTVVQYYRHATQSDARHHCFEMRNWKPDKTGYTSHRAPWVEMMEEALARGWIVHPQCVPGD